MATDSGDPRHGTPNGMLSPQMRRGLTLLRRAWEDTPREGHKTWNPAVPIQELTAAGLTDHDLVCLLHAGYVSFAGRTTDPAEHHATASPDGKPHFTEASCFLLTGAGLILTQFTVTDEPEQRHEPTPAWPIQPELPAIPD